MYLQFLEPAPLKYLKPHSSMSFGEDGSQEQFENCIKISRLLIDPQLTKIKGILIKGNQLEQ